MSADTNQRSHFNAHCATEEALVRIVGLARGLYELASESKQLNNPDPMSNAILSLIVAIEEKAAQAQTAHEAEYAAGHAEAEAARSAAA